MGLAELEEEFAQSGDDPAAYPAPAVETFTPPHLLAQLPVDVVDEPEVPMSWLTLDVVPTYQTGPFEETSPLRVQVFYLLALLKLLREKLLAFEQDQQNRDPEQALYPALAYQLEQIMQDMGGHLTRIRCRCHAEGQRALALEAEHEEQERLAEERQKVAETRILVVGDDRISTLYSKVGTLLNGRHAAISMAVAQVLIAIGLQGTGKTQGAALLRETVHLLLPGLGRMTRGGKTVSIEVDFNSGQTRRSSLSGIYPSPYPEHRERLKGIFGFDQIVAFPQIDVIVLPGTAPHYRKEFQKVYDEEHERLVLHELAMDPSEQDSLFYRLMLPMGTKGNGQTQTQARTLLDSIIGNLGVGCHPDRILQEFVRAKFPGVNEAAFRSQFQLIKNITTPGQFLIDRLNGDNPQVLLMESRYLGPRRLLSLEVAVMAALSAILRDGSNPLRWFILHELGKQALHEVVAPYLIERTAEVRHNVCSYYLETQQTGFLPKELVALCTGILQCKTTNQQDYQLLQQLFYAFQGIPFKQVAELPPGCAFLAFQHASDPMFCNQAFFAHLRPTATWAGGETMLVG